MNSHIGRLSTILRRIKIHTDELKQPSCSLLTWGKGKTTKHQDLNQLAIKLCCKYWWQIMENLRKSLQFSFDFQTLELISQSLQPSQNRAKDPKRKSWAQHLHVSPMTLRFESLLNWRSCDPHKSHLRRGGRTWYPDSNWNCTERDIFKKLSCTTGHISFLKVLQKTSKIPIHVQSGSSFEWVGRHKPNIIKTEKSKHSTSLTSHVTNNHIRRPSTILFQIKIIFRRRDELKHSPCCLLILK